VNRYKIKSRASPRHVTLAVFELGEEYLQKGDYENAIKEYTAAILLAPGHAVFYGARGMACYRNRQYENAISDFTEAILLAPIHAVYYGARGMAYFRNKQYDNAVSDFANTVRLNPETLFACWGRALLYHETGEYDKAIDEYTEILKRCDSYCDDDFLDIDEIYPCRGKACCAPEGYEDEIGDCSEEIDAYLSEIREYRNLKNRLVTSFYEYDDIKAGWVNPFVKKGSGSDILTQEEVDALLAPVYHCDIGIVYAYNRRGEAYRANGEHVNARVDFETAAELDWRTEKRVGRCGRLRCVGSCAVQ